MKLSLTAFLVVAIGGAIGAMCRYVVTMVMTRQFGDGFPWGTLTVNVVGALVIGIAFVWADRSLLTEHQRLLLILLYGKPTGRRGVRYTDKLFPMVTLPLGLV